jgi:hypothetical protein
MSRLLIQPFDRYFEMWNEADPSRIRAHLDLAVTEDFIFCDPLNWHVGRDALEDNVQQFRQKYPEATLHVTSDFDHHHNRYRYEWQILLHGRTVLTGMDIATVADDGLIERVDGFFGPVK